MRRGRVLCGGAVVACAAFGLMGQAAPASPKLGETEPSLMMPENASFEIGADGNFLYETAEPGGVYYLHTEDIAWPAEKLNEDDYIDALEQLYRAG